MAKAAKHREPEITEAKAKKFLRNILDHYESIESARGRYMNLARREREAMASIYEGMAAQGISQKASKTNVKIVRAMQKIAGWLADLELEDRKMAQRLAKAQDDKRQLSLFAELPKPTKAEIREAEAKAAETETAPATLTLVEGAA